MSKAQPDNKSTTSNKSGKLHSAIEKAQAIQQREQLRQMIVDKFNKDFAKGNKNIIKIIEEVVTHFFEKEKVTEDTLRQLKQTVTKAVQDYRRDNKSQTKKQSTTSKQEIDQRNAEDKKSQAPSQRSQKRNQQALQDKQSVRSGHSSDTSSLASKSVYQVQGDDEDEWATLVKFDTQLFKKQKQLQHMRQQQFKKKIKKQLDKQMQQKSRKKQAEQIEQQQYFQLQQQQAITYDQRQKEKQQDYERKIQLQKQMRDRQVKDQTKRKKLQKRKEDQLDQLLVQKIKEELTLEQRENKERKLKELNRFQQVIAENEVNQQRLKEEAERERLEDIKAQQQYARLQDELQKKREEEKKEREDKIKAVMASFADSVIKDQKQQIRAQDDKMMRHIEHQLQKQKEQEERKRLAQEQEKQRMRNYLARQVEQKRQKEIDEKKIDQKQAHVWKEDTNSFLENEKQKQQYLKGVYKKHEEVLVAQMQDKEDHKNRKKMNTLELLYNKALMKAAADKADNVKKTKV